MSNNEYWNDADSPEGFYWFTRRDQMRDDGERVNLLQSEFTCSYGKCRAKFRSYYDNPRLEVREAMDIHESRHLLQVIADRIKREEK